jgi:hypothetical protein
LKLSAGSAVYRVLLIITSAAAVAAGDHLVDECTID